MPEDGDAPAGLPPPDSPPISPGTAAAGSGAATSDLATSTRYRILHLIKGLGRGGAEMLLSEGLRHADRRRFEHGYGYLLSWKDQLADCLAAQQATVHCFHADGNLALPAAVWRIAAFARRWRADLLHCHLPLAGVIGRLAGRLAEVPVVYTEHNVMERYHPLTRRANRWTWGLQEVVVAVSGDVKAAAERWAGHRVPVRVVHNGIDVDLFSRDEDERAAVRRDCRIPPTAQVMGTVAVFRSQKRLDLWLEVARLIADRQPEIHFLVVGDGPLRGELEQQAAAAGLGRRLHWVGLQSHVRPFLAAMDLLLISSRYEGLPLALLEAMAVELPVVATAVGGIPEVVLDGVTGLLVTEASADLLARQVEQLMATPARAREMGAAGRRRVLECFSLQRMARATEEVYLEVLGAGSDDRDRV